MTRTLQTLLLAYLLTAGVVLQAQESNVELKIEEEITDEDVREFLEKREEYKDDPEALKFLDKVQEAAGITEADIARARGEAPPANAEQQQPAVEGNSNVAEQAYHNRDYETALKHYEALAAEGDAYANLMLGLMYHQGQGVDTDMTRAHAYYDRAAEYGDDRGRELTETLEMDMSEQEIKEAREKHAEIVEQQKEAGAPEAEPREEREKYPAVITESGRPAEP